MLLVLYQTYVSAAGFVVVVSLAHTALAEDVVVSIARRMFFCYAQCCSRSSGVCSQDQIFIACSDTVATSAHTSGGQDVPCG